MAIVFNSYPEMKEMIDRDDFEVTEDHILVLRNVGPVGGPGMPEWGMMPIPKIPPLHRRRFPFHKHTLLRTQSSSHGLIQMQILWQRRSLCPCAKGVEENRSEEWKVPTQDVVPRLMFCRLVMPQICACDGCCGRGRQRPQEDAR